MYDFILWNTKDNIFRNVSASCCPYIGRQWLPKLFGYQQGCQNIRFSLHDYRSQPVILFCLVGVFLVNFCSVNHTANTNVGRRRESLLLNHHLSSPLILCSSSNYALCCHIFLGFMINKHHLIYWRCWLIYNIVFNINKILVLSID